ncbi:hypothetical protein Tco_1404363 [Tanacetum coccineum]
MSTEQFSQSTTDDVVTDRKRRTSSRVPEDQRRSQKMILAFDAFASSILDLEATEVVFKVLDCVAFSENLVLGATKVVSGDFGILELTEKVLRAFE